MRAFEVTRWLSVMDTAGKLVTVSWPSLATMLSTPTPARTKLDAAAWSPATFAGSRTAANVVEVSALVRRLRRRSFTCRGGTGRERPQRRVAHVVESHARVPPLSLGGERVALDDAE